MLEVLDVSSHEITNPRSTREIGASFIYWGKINEYCESGGSHLIILPVIIDMVANNSIGVIICTCSVILINEEQEFDLHIVTNLNRIE